MSPSARPARLPFQGCVALCALSGLAYEAAAEPLELGVSSVTVATLAPQPAKPVRAFADVFALRIHSNLDGTGAGTPSELLTKLLDIDGIRVVADTESWNRPETLAIQHFFRTNLNVRPYLALGINRAVYFDSSFVSPVSTRFEHGRHSVGMLAEGGLSWQLNDRLGVSADVRWLDLSSSAVLLRSNAGYYMPADPVAVTLSASWWH